MPVQQFDDYGNEYPDDGDYLVRVKRSQIRQIEQKADAYDRLMAEQADAEAGRDEHGDTLLEDGEADLGSHRRALSANSPADEVQPQDPYREAERIFNREIDEGRQQKHAAGAALNALVNAAARGDKRVIIPSRSTQALGGG